MRDLCSFDYAIIRVVPRVERGEFINAGVIMFCSTQAWLESRVELPEDRLRALDPAVDVDLVKTHLAAIPVICRGGEEAGPIGRLSQRERFHWLTAPRSTMIQTSPLHSGVHHDLEKAFEQLLQKLVR